MNLKDLIKQKIDTSTYLGEDGGLTLGIIGISHKDDKCKILIPIILKIQCTEARQEVLGSPDYDVVSSKQSPDQYGIAADDLLTSRKSAQTHQFTLSITMISLWDPTLPK